jgi:hypothetical protein
MGDNGLETDDVTSKSSNDLGQTANERAAESGAVGDGGSSAQADLARVVVAWPRLPEGVRGRIVAMVEEANRCEARS